METPLTQRQLSSCRSQLDTSNDHADTGIIHVEAQVSGEELNRLRDINITALRGSATAKSTAAQAPVPSLGSSRVDAEEQRERVDFGPDVSSLQCPSSVINQ
jgi:hypothetical protein